MASGKYRNAEDFDLRGQAGTDRRTDCCENHMTRAQLVRKLLLTLHLNVPERRQLVPPAIDFAELMADIQGVVDAGAASPRGN